MRNEKALISLIRKIADLLSEECIRNHDFAERLAALIPDSSKPKVQRTKTTKSPDATPLPDIHAEWSARGGTDFRLWIRNQPISILRAIISSQGFDPPRRTTKWKESEKLAEFIYDNLCARISRGASFIRSERESKERQEQQDGA